MLLGKCLSRLDIAAADGAEDVAFLLHTLGGAQTVGQREPPQPCETVSLRGEVICHQGVAGPFQEDFVERLNRFDLRFDITRSLGYAHRGHRGVQRCHLFCGGSLCAQGGHAPFDGCAHLEDLANAVFIDHGNRGPLVWNLGDPPLGLQLAQTFAHDGPADIQKIAELSLHQSRAWW